MNKRTTEEGERSTGKNVNRKHLIFLVLYFFCGHKTLERQKGLSMMTDRVNLASKEHIQPQPGRARGL